MPCTGWGHTPLRYPGCVAIHLQIFPFSREISKDNFGGAKYTKSTYFAIYKVAIKPLTEPNCLIIRQDKV